MSQDKDGTLKGSEEGKTEEKAPPVVEQPLPAEGAGTISASSPQDDIDALFDEAMSQDQDGASKDSAEGKAEEASPPAAEQTTPAEGAGTVSASAPQDDIDALFAEAVSQQQDGTLGDSAEGKAAEERPPAVEPTTPAEGASSGDLLWDRLSSRSFSARSCQDRWFSHSHG